MDVSSHIAAWERHLTHVVGASPNTVEAYVRDVRAFDGALTRDGIEDFLSRLGEKGIKASSRGRKLASLRSFCRFLVDRGHLMADPTAKVVAPKAAKTLPKPMGKGEMERMLDACPPTSRRRACLRALVDLAWSCGLRVSELLSIRLVDLQDGSILVRGKGDKERRVPVAEPTLESIRAWLAFRGDGGDLLFVTRGGTAMDRHAVATSMRGLAKSVGIDGFSPHRARHSCATGLLEGGADLLSIQTMLGHASCATTQKYLLISDIHLRTVVLACHPRSKVGSAEKD